MVAALPFPFCCLPGAYLRELLDSATLQVIDFMVARGGLEPPTPAL